jgi:hypothetical protein
MPAQPGLLLPRQPPGLAGIAEILARGAEDIVVISFPKIIQATPVDLKVPGAYWYRVLSINAAMSTDATATTRQLQVVYLTPDGTQLALAGYSVNYGAGLQADTTFGVGIPFRAQGPTASSDGSANLLDTILPSGYVIRLRISNPGAGDRIARPVYVVERYPTAIRGQTRAAVSPLPASLIEREAIVAEGTLPPPPPPPRERPPEEEGPEGEGPSGEGLGPTGGEEEGVEHPSIPPHPTPRERPAGEELIRRLREEEERRRRMGPSVRLPGEIPRGRPLAE